MSAFLRKISILKEIVYPEEWSIAIRERKKALLFQKDGQEQPFEVLNNNFRYWTADPFLFEKEGKSYLFFEMFDRLKGKGGIGVREYNHGHWSPMHMICEKPFHLSFPFVYETNGKICLMPEASYDKCVPVLEAIDFPWKWKEVKRILDGEKVCDSVIYEKEDIQFLFTQPIEIPYTFDKLNLYVQTGNGNWRIHPASPICKKNQNGARMAGAIIEMNEDVYRCGQDCQGGYGKGLCFFRIDKIDSHEYHETPVCQIFPNDLNLLQSGTFTGCHTYNINNHFEVIDLKIEKFSLRNLYFILLGKLIRFLHKGYKLCPNTKCLPMT